MNATLSTWNQEDLARPDGLIHQCLQLLDDEVAQLRRVREEVLALREAILIADSLQLQQRLAQHGSCEQAMAELRQRRQVARAEIAALLHIDPSKASIGQLVRAAGDQGDADLARKCREVELEVKSLEVELLSTVALIQHSMSLFDRILQMLTGQGEGGTRYSKQGLAVRGSCGAFLQRKC